MALQGRELLNIDLVGARDDNHILLFDGRVAGQRVPQQGTTHSNQHNQIYINQHQTRPKMKIDHSSSKDQQVTAKDVAIV